MNFLQLTETDGKKVYINLDTVTVMKPEQDVLGKMSTALIFKDDGRRFFVRETPEQILCHGSNAQ